ncbi:MAG: hypothetical protein KKD31_03555 [Bacteroidetes bacterium]|nr:hypothetical protein [Bacteroidota bacterium]
MQVFINECSLNEQFDKYSFVEAIKVFLRTINFFNQFEDKKVLKSELFFNFKALKNTHFGTSLKTNMDLNSVFLQNFKSAISWENSQEHDVNSSYVFNNEEYVKTTIAEITERKIINPLLDAVLLNFLDSKFSDHSTISVRKNDSIDTKINCAFNETSVYEWLIENRIIDSEVEYNESLGLPPLDKQTVLCTSGMFELTKWRNGKFGRKVYKLKGVNQFWVIDNSIHHATNKAHIEIFDAITKKHLGTSIYNKIELNSTHLEKGRTINLV